MNTEHTSALTDAFEATTAQFDIELKEILLGDLQHYSETSTLPAA